MFQLILRLVEAIQPVIVPLCFVSAWLFTILLLLTLKNALGDATVRTKQMHRIPCTSCQFFNNDHRLKCSIQPYIANTESAIDCSDYQEKKGIGMYNS
jgi:hypothetical protein